MKSLWFISKYVVPPYAAISGARGFLILREMAKMGVDCHLICSDSNHLAKPPVLTGPVLDEEIDGVRVHWLRTRKYKGSASIGRIISWLDFEWQLFKMPKVALGVPDVIIVSSLSLITILSGLYLRRKYRCKLVFEVRDIWPLSLQELRGLSRWHPAVLVLAWVERLGYRHADLVVGTMPNLQARVTEVLGYARPVGCIPQGVDVAPSKITQDSHPMSPSLPKGKFIVAYAGSVGLGNALNSLFEAARALRNRNDIHFLILGKGELMETFQTANADLPNLTFVGALPKSAMQSVLDECDLMYLSSPKSRIWDYGQSKNKVIDYMLSGKPVLAAYSGFPSMLNEAGCGRFIAAEDTGALIAAIEEFAAMPKPQRDAMGQAGRDWVLKHRPFSELAKAYLQLIEKIA
jgi:glycosyltransferase involved in cell wall biosynthesis